MSHSEQKSDILYGRNQEIERSTTGRKQTTNRKTSRKTVEIIRAASEAPAQSTKDKVYTLDLLMH